MQKFFGADVWQELQRFSLAKGPMRVAVAYYTSDTLVRCGRGDTLIVNASRDAIISGQTTPSLLVRAAGRGAKVYSHPRLHAKFIILRDVLFVGSANFSSSSRALREAGVLTRDAQCLEHALSYFELLRREATPQDMTMLRKLMALPVVSRGPHCIGLSKPSLLEAIRDGLKELNDVGFSWYTQDVELTERAVKKQAVARDVPLPPDRTDWTWVESKNEPDLLARMNSTSRGKPQVSWRCRLDKNGGPARLLAHDPFAAPFLGAIRLKNRVVSLVGTYSSPTPFDLRRDRVPLARVLNIGLRRAPTRLKRAINNDLSRFTPGHLQSLYQLGIAE